MAIDAPEPRRDGPYEAPVTSLAAGRGQRRRATAAILSIGLVIGGAIGLARLGDAGRTSDAARASAGAARAAAASSDTARASAAASAASRRSTGPRTEHLLDVPNRELGDPPSVVLVERAGRDVQLRRWSPGSEMANDGVFRGALTTEDPDVLTVLSPTDDRLLVFEPGSSTDPSDERGRIVDATGRVLWTGDHLTAISGAAWSPGGDIVVMAGTSRVWHLVRIDATGRATDHPVTLPFRVFLPTPLPRGDLTVPRVDPRTLPLGYSADGRWVYGGVASAQLGLLVATFRVAVDGSVIEPVADLGVGRADGLEPRPGTIGGRLVDPGSGRIATFRPNADTSGGPPTIEVRNPDEGAAFAVADGTPVGSGWGADGGLYVLTANAPLFADQVRLVRYGPDGTAAEPILRMGPLTGADLLGVAGDYAALAGSVSRPDRAVQLIMVDVIDPTRISAVRLPDGEADTILGVELRG